MACIVTNPAVGCQHLTPGPQRHTCIVMNPVVGCHHLPPGPERHTCIFMNLVVGCHHLPPGPQWHTCIVINPVVGCHHLPPGPQRQTCIFMNPVVGCHHLPPDPQRHTCIVINPVVGFCHFPPGPQLPFHMSGITALSYTAWWQRHSGVRNVLSISHRVPSRNANPKPLDRKSDAPPMRYNTTLGFRTKLKVKPIISKKSPTHSMCQCSNRNVFNAKLVTFKSFKHVVLGYLPRRRASPPLGQLYKIILLGDRGTSV